MIIVIQGLKCLFCFNLILATGKHWSYSESTMLKKIYACFIGVSALSCFAPVYIMQPYLNVPIDWSENLCLNINSFLAFSFLAIYKRKLKNNRDVSFYNPWFKPSVHHRVCDDMINRSGSLSSSLRGFINCWKIYKILNFFLCITI